MADLTPVSPGEPFRFLDADVANALLDMARAYRNGSLGRLGGLQASAPQGDPISVVVQNRTGSALDQYGVVGFSDALVPYATSATEFKRRPQLRGAAPTATGPFGIVQQPLANWVSDSTPKTIGRAVVAGVTVCKLNVTSSGDTHASPTTSTTELTTGTSGPARILAKESGTGSGKWGLVLITNSAASSSASATYDCWYLTSDYTATKTDSGGSVELTGWTRAIHGTTATRPQFPSTGTWLVTLHLTGDFTVSANGGTTAREGYLIGEITNYSGNTSMSLPTTTNSLGMLPGAYAVNGAGNYKGGGTLTLQAVVSVTTASADGLTITLFYGYPGGGSPTGNISIYSYLALVGAVGPTFVMMQKIG